ncbi:MAG: 8-amino-7-oxononanoate synthase [Lysobacterales bacterium]
MPRTSLIDRASAACQQRLRADLDRRLRRIDAARGARILIDGRALISFASNDYLGMAQDPRLVAALKSAADDWGVGATAAHLLGGHRAPHQALEEALADWLGYPRALLFSTGTMANLGVLSALLGRGDLCLQDKLNHASLLDGARLSGAELRRYAHADTEVAERLLQAHPDRATLLASDGVFSMDGDLAPLAALAALAAREQATLMVDDAHGIGVLDWQGRGSVAAAGLGVAEVPILMLTLGKALGSFGAVVLGSTSLIDSLVQFARPYIYTTALPPALAAATLCAVRIARDEDWRRAHLHELIQRFRRDAAAIGLNLLPSDTPIQPLLIGASAEALAWSSALEQHGLYVPAVRPPTVPEHAARLRITLSAGHTMADVEALLCALRQTADALRPAA